MDENWDDSGSAQASTYDYNGVASEGGRNFSAGRGFKSVIADNDEGWGGGSADNGADNIGEWNDDYNSKPSFRDDRRERGRGGGRGGFRSRNNHNENNDYDRNGRDSEYQGGRGGGRGRGRGQGGRRGGRSDNDYSQNENDEGPKKPTEIYIPVERTTDEDLFTTGITSGINFMKLAEIDVNVTGEDIPPPITSFESSGLRELVINNVKKSGYTRPTPIQKYSIPIIMNGRDLMGCAQTGSGKTAAFLLPIINTLISSQDPPIVEGSTAQPYVVIISPTRELTIQIYEQAKKFSYNSIVRVVEVYGGTSTMHQRKRILNGCHIVVATSGRLKDFVDKGTISFASVKYFILDEADRMLDMGFLPEVETMLGHPTMTAAGDRQTLMFSATFPEEIQHMAGKFLYNYIFITVGIIGSASTDVEQSFIQVSKFDKRKKLLEILKNDRGSKCLVFVETKRNADFVAAFLCENDIKTTSIHGDRLQREREQALWDFKKGICPVMVATGVGARGLDIEGVQHVVNFDLPNSIDEYVHRIGRTGRVGNRGRATGFFDPNQDSKMAGSLSKILQQANQEIPEWLSSGHFDFGGGDDNFGGRDIRGDDFGRAQSNNIPDEVEEEW